jgi:hypothetical protein
MCCDVVKAKTEHLTYSECTFPAFQLNDRSLCGTNLSRKTFMRVLRITIDELTLQPFLSRPVEPEQLRAMFLSFLMNTIKILPQLKALFVRKQRKGPSDCSTQYEVSMRKWTMH